MYFSDRITLRTETIGQDADGYPTTTYDDVEVWANRKSVTRSEFYSANAVGIDLTISFEVHFEDYSGQKTIVADNKQYTVVRTYQKGEGTIELSCSDKAV